MARSRVSTSLRERSRKPMSNEERKAVEGVMLSIDEGISTGESGER